MTSEEPLASRLFERAYGWLATPRDSLPMCAARAGIGSTLVAAYCQYLPQLEFFYGPSGVGGHETIARHQHFWGITYEWYARFRVLHTFESSAPIWFLYALLLICGTAFALGYKPRIAGVVAAVLHIVFYAHNPFIDGHWGALMGPFIIYLTMCDCGSQLSVDAWLRRRRGDPPPSGVTKAAPWGMRLLQVHLCVMYLVPGFERLDAEGWVNGEMVLRSLMNTQYGRFDVRWMAIAPLLKWVNWTVLILEPAAPIVLWLRGVGRYWALALMAMHFGLELFLDAGWWQFMMMSALLTFVPPRWIRKVVRALRLAPTAREASG